MSVTNPFIVIYDADAILEFEEVKSREERRAVFTCVDKLRRLGAKLPTPHMKSLKNEPNLWELRPHQGRARVRPIYSRLPDDEFVILAFAVAADKADFGAAVDHARSRLVRYRK